MTRVAIVIDGLNITRAATRLNKRVDYALLARVLSDNGRREILFKNFYVGPMRNGGCDQLKREIEELGYAWICCESLSSRPDRLKSTVDLSVAMDMLTWAFTSRIDIVFLAAGDGDYCKVVHRVREMGIRVYLLGIGGDSHVADVLLREISMCDFLDLGKLGVLRPVASAAIQGAGSEEAEEAEA